MTVLAFLSPDQATADARLASPLARALRGSGLNDLSLLGKIEVRGELGEPPAGCEAIRISPERSLLLCAYDRCAGAREELQARGLTVIDQTGALAGLRVEGEAVLRRLTELDLSALPAVGMVAHARTFVLRDGDSFRLFFPQELGHYVAECVLDATEAL